MLGQVAETVLPVNSHIVESPITVWDRPRRCLVIVLDDESSSIPPPGTPVPDLLEGVCYPGGTIRVFGQTFVDGPKRALVVLLNETPRLPVINMPTAAEPPTDPVQVENLIIDLEDVNEIEDGGDHIYIGFGAQHQPPFLFLTGDKADQFRKLGLSVHESPHKYLSEAELNDLAQKAVGQEPVEAQLVSRLIADVRALRNNRMETILTAGRLLQAHLDHAEQLVQMLAGNQVHRVRCTHTGECQVHVDGSCTCEASTQS